MCAGFFMKKILIFIGLILILVFLSKSSVSASEERLRDLDLRRMNMVVLSENHIENSTVKIEMLKSLSAYDLMQIKLHAGRLFIRDKIIME